MKHSIFISSTYQDLKPHRNQIWKVLQDFDADVTGMEAFGAQMSKPLDTCLNELKKSDIYIGVISMCYGSVDEETGKSFTQIEYEKAKELGLEILIYLVDENNGLIKTGDVDFGDKYLRLNGLKKILKKNHTVDFFLDEFDLGKKICSKLEKLISRHGDSISRPKSVDTKIFKFKLSNTNWSIFIGYINDKPIEIFSTISDDDDGILLPSNIDSGKLIKEMDVNGNERYDFCFSSKRGYKTTCEGINELFEFQINTYDKVITKLLQSNVHLNTIIETVRQMEVENSDYVEWKDKIIEILKK